MSIQPFQIVNPDGSINQSEYNRCVEFLNNYVNGDISVYPTVTWANPFEVDMSQKRSSFTLLSEILQQQTNKLLTSTAMNDIKRLFKGIIERYGCTIHTFGRYLEQSANFPDGPGYMYDVLSRKETVVKKEPLGDIVVYYLDDDNHTVIEYNDNVYGEDTNLQPVANFPTLSNTYITQTPNKTDYPSVIQANPSGIYSDFQALAGQYTGSSTLFYYSQCNDGLYTSSGNSYNQPNIGIINFRFNTTVSNKSNPARGVDTSLISTLQNAIVNPDMVNAYIPSTNFSSGVPYLSPTFFTAADTTEWYV